ncbi:MAG: branched-chain amino acid ABC transporter permease, partial [Rhizobiales bacterium]|nr:branched-chain amino acid ABC transporter permease [Hyphomicrobiales bacterium]
MTTAPLDKGTALQVSPRDSARTTHTVVFWMGFCAVMAVLIAAPLVLPEFWRRLTTEILIWGLLAMSSDLLIGYTGMVSFGHSAFFGLGMYGAAGALIAVKTPNLWLAILCGLAAAAGAALFVAYFSTRLRDIYFAITTLIFSQIFYVIIFTWTPVTGGENGLIFTRPRLWIPFLYYARFNSTTMHWFVLAVVAGS